MYNITVSQAKAFAKQAAKNFDIKTLYALARDLLSRVSIRKSFIIKTEKQGNNIVVTVTGITAKTSVCATETKKTWDKFLWIEYNHKASTNMRGLTAKELVKINQAIDDKTRSLIERYFN